MPCLFHHVQKSQLTAVTRFILRPVYWQGAFGELQALPTDALPVTDPEWHNLDRAFFNVVEGIRRVVEELTRKSLKSNTDVQ